MHIHGCRQLNSDLLPHPKTPSCSCAQKSKGGHSWKKFFVNEINLRILEDVTFVYPGFPNPTWVFTEQREVMQQQGGQSWGGGSWEGWGDNPLKQKGGKDKIPLFEATQLVVICPSALGI